MLKQKIDIKTDFLICRFSLPFDNSRGYALAVILSISLILMIICAGITSQVRSRIRSAQKLENRSKAFLKATSGFNQVMYNLLTSSFEPYSIKIHRTDGNFDKWNLYGKPVQLNPDVTVKLRDSAGMIPLLYGNDRLKKLWFKVATDSGKAASFIDAFLDWQDKDKLKRLNGAEDWEYRKAGYQYEPKNNLIQFPEEMKLVLGFDSDIYQTIMDSVSYRGTQNRNYLTMDNQTLYALISNQDIVDTIIDLREKNILTPAMFKSMTGIPVSMSVVYFPSNEIVVKIRAQHENSVDSMLAIVEKKEGKDTPFKIIEWR